jgi:hypothetical protein
MSTALMTEPMTKASAGFKTSDVRVSDFSVSNLGAINYGASDFRVPGLRTKIPAVVGLLGVLTAASVEGFVRGNLSVVGGLVAVLSMIVVTLLFSDNSNPVKRRLALLAAVFNLAGLVFEALRFQPHGANIAIVFNGFFCMLVGYMAFKSALVFRILGALIALGGLGWLSFFSPSLANYLSPYSLAFGLLGAGLATLWLLGIGVNAQPWKEQVVLENQGRISEEIRQK